MAKLDRYLLKQFFFIFFISAFAFVSLGLLDVLFTLLDYVVNKGISPVVIVQLLLLKIPSVIVVFSPLMVMFASELTLFNIIKDNEWLVLVASGVSRIRIVFPLIVSALVLSCLSFIINEFWVPFSNFQSNSLIHKVILKESMPIIEENTFFKDVDNKVIYIGKIDPDHKTLHNILIYELDSFPPRVIFSKTALWNTHEWLLRDGGIHEFASDGLIKLSLRFDQLRLSVNYSMDSAYQKIKSVKEMSIHEILQRISELKALGMDTRDMLVEVAMKCFLPFYNFLFMLIGVGLVTVLVRTGKDAWGIIVTILASLALVTLSFFLSALFRAFAMGGQLNSFLAAALPLFVISISLWIVLAILRHNYFP